MLYLETIEQYQEVVSGLTDKAYCLLFVAPRTPQSDAVITFLREACSRLGMSLLLVDVSNMAFYSLLIKYKVGPTPQTNLIRNDEILHREVGTFGTYEFNRILKKAGLENVKMGQMA